MGYFERNGNYIDVPAAKFSDLIGKTITAIINDEEDYRLTIVCSDGSEYVQYHSQDCCESVYIESIVGDIQDIIDSPVVFASEETNNDKQHPEKDDDGTHYYDDSFTWTFYKIDTIKGGITIRWFGSSNGYYSESVDFYMSKAPNASM